MTPQAAAARMTRFRSLATAHLFAVRCLKLHMVLLGDDGLFWVGLPAATETLCRAGLEYA